MDHDTIIQKPTLQKSVTQALLLIVRGGRHQERLAQ